MDVSTIYKMCDDTFWAPTPFSNENKKMYDESKQVQAFQILTVDGRTIIYPNMIQVRPFGRVRIVDVESVVRVGVWANPVDHSQL